jgi:hypothetical protein
MIILACDNCKRQSPNADGLFIAGEWVSISMKRQRDRDRDHAGVRLMLCEVCFPLLGTEVKVAL